MLVKIYPENPNEKEIERICELLENDGVIIFPTDSVYAFGCSLRSKKAYDRILQIKNLNKKEARFSLICSDLSNLSSFAKVGNSVFKILKRNLPGSFTFILTASTKVPDKLLGKRKTVGLRVPNNSITKAIVDKLGTPLLATSIKINDDVVEYLSDPELIYEEFSNRVDLCIDGGLGGLDPSTIVDCTGDQVEIIRQGVSELIV